MNTFCKKYQITKRENEVVKLVLSGKNRKDIAKELVIASSTVQIHIKNIYRKTRVNNIISLINSVQKVNTESDILN